MVQIDSECPNKSSSTPQSHSLCHLLIEIFFNQSQRRWIHHEWKQRLPFKTLFTCLLASYYISLDAAVIPGLLGPGGMFILEKAHTQSFSWWTTLSNWAPSNTAVQSDWPQGWVPLLLFAQIRTRSRGYLTKLDWRMQVHQWPMIFKAQAFKSKSLLPSPISKFFI